MGTPGSPLTTEQITTGLRADILKAERDMRAIAEEQASGYRDVLLEIIEGIAPGFLEEHRAEKPRAWQPDRWAAHVADIMIQARETLGNQKMLVEGLRQQIEAVAQEKREMAQEIARLRTELERRSAAHLQAARQARQMPLPVAAEPAPPSSSASPKPAPLPAPETGAPAIQIPSTPPDGWALGAQTYVADATLVGLIGKTGRCSRPWLSAQLASLIGVSHGRTGTVRRTIERCRSADWIDVVEGSGVWARGYPHLLRLSELGERLYRDLFDQDPAPSDLTRLLDAHLPRGENHAVLCVAAADQFERLGLAVRLVPEPISINGSVYAADLEIRVSRDAGETDVWLVECERAAGAADGRRAKWHNSITVQGAVFLVTTDAKKRDHLIEEVRALGRPCRVYASYMTGLRNATTPQEAWVSVKEFK